MNAEGWKDLLDGFVYLYAQPVYYAVAMFLALLIMAQILQFAMNLFMSRGKDD